MASLLTVPFLQNSSRWTEDYPSAVKSCQIQDDKTRKENAHRLEEKVKNTNP